MDKDFIKKNLLDLDMQKYLQLSSTSVIIFFSYLIGVFVAIISNQTNFEDVNVSRLFLIVSVVVLGYTSILFFLGLKKIQRITRAIREMYDEGINA